MAGHSTRCLITESGADMPKGVVVAETRLRLLRRIVPKDELDKLVHTSFKPYEEIAEHFDITVSDLDGLMGWYEIPKRRHRPSPSTAGTRVDLLAVRVLELIRPELDNIDAQANRLWIKIKPLVEALLDEYTRGTNR